MSRGTYIPPVIKREKSVKEYVDKYNKAPLVSDSRQLEEVVQTLVNALDTVASAYLEASQNMQESISRIKELCGEEE